MDPIEHISGCLSVRLTPIGGITVLLAPVCTVDLGPDKDIPKGVLRTVDGRPIKTADGEYLIVSDGVRYTQLGTADGAVLVTADGLRLRVDND